MSNEKIEDLGCLPNGGHLYRERNGVGGWIYSSDEIGGGVVVWDTCLVAESTILAAIVCEHHRHYMESMHKRGWKPKEDMTEDPMATNNGLFLDPIKNGSVDNPTQTFGEELEFGEFDE